MADITNLSSFLEDVADAIRSKTGKTDTLAAENFDTEIMSISSGTVTDPLVIKTNIVVEEDEYVTASSSPITEPTLIPAEGTVHVSVDKETLAENIGLTADKILIGERVLDIDGIAEAGLEISGSVEINVLANGDIQKGDVCALSEVESSYQGLEVTKIPTSSSNLAIDHTRPIVVFENGKLIFTAAIDGSNTRWRPFYLVDGVYKPVSGLPAALPYSMTGNTMFYNETTKWLYFWYSKYLYIYQLNESSLTFTNIASKSSTYAPFSNMYPFNFRNSFFGQYVMYMAPADTTWTYELENLYKLLGFTASDAVNDGVYYNTCDIKTQGDNVWLSCSTTTRTLRNTFILKMLATEEGKMSKISQLDVTSFIGKGIANIDAPLQFCAKNSYVMYLDAQHTLHRMLFDGELMTLTNANLTFSDGLDVTNIADYVYTNEDYLYIKVNDSITTETTVRLYRFSASSGMYEFIGYPSTFFTPNTSNVLPLSKRYGYLTGVDNIFMHTKSNVLTKYSVGKPETEYSHYATSTTDNNLSDEESTVAYGVAIEDIANTAVGKCEMMLTGQDMAFNNVIDNKIGGIY